MPAVSASRKGRRASGTVGRLRRGLVSLIARLHRWAESGSAGPAVGVWGTMQGSVVPGPSEALFVPLALADPRRAFHLAVWATLGATVGGIFAYAIGAYAFDSVGGPLLGLFGVGPARLASLEALFERRGAELILFSTLTPLSTKLVCIAAGAFGVPFPEFALALIAGRAARFLLIGLLLRYAGEGLMRRLERRLGKPIEAVK
jgi:membrane protein YqaA with SNARE-associated domain